MAIIKVSVHKSGISAPADQLGDHNCHDHKRGARMLPRGKSQCRGRLDEGVDMALDRGGKTVETSTMVRSCGGKRNRLTHHASSQLTGTPLVRLK